MEEEKLKYHIYQELITELNLIQEEHPEIVSMETIGLSHEGRDIVAVKISDTPQERDKDPAVLFTSLIHGLEVIGLEVLLRLMNKLTADYGKDEYVTNLVKNREIWFIPVINPDGFVRHHRKNSRGVDLNRNFSVGFNRSWLSRWKKWFFHPGEYPFSESETKAVKDFIESHKFIIFCSFHSFWGMINFPYGHKKEKARDYKLFRAIGGEMAMRQPHSSYKVRQMSWFFKPSGTLEDEIYGSYNTLAFCIEVSKGKIRFLKPSTWFNPFRWFNPENIQYQVENHLVSSLYLLEIADNPEKVLQ